MSRSVAWFPGVPLETMTVYQTAEHPDIKKNLKNYFSEQVNTISRAFKIHTNRTDANFLYICQGTPASIAFFSPSGVKFCLEVIRRLSGEQLMQIKVQPSIKLHLTDI